MGSFGSSDKWFAELDDSIAVTCPSPSHIIISLSNIPSPACSVQFPSGRLSWLLVSSAGTGIPLAVPVW